MPDLHHNACLHMADEMQDMFKKYDFVVVSILQLLMLHPGV